MKRIKVTPPEDYFVAFLSTRGRKIVHEDPNVLHYFGTSYRKLKKLVREDAPDVTFIHSHESLPGKDNLPFSFVYDPVNNEGDIYKNKKVVTNAPGLAKVYYRAMGLSREVVDITPEVPDIKQRQPLPNIINKVFRNMMWN